MTAYIIGDKTYASDGPILRVCKMSAMNSADVVMLARETRRNAEAFAATVRKFSEEMPHHLDRFHEAMSAFRGTAAVLQKR